MTIRDEAGRTTGYRCVHCGDLDPGHAHPVGEERDPGQLGQRPVPIRLFIADTMRAVEAALHTTADQIADSVQRQPIRPAPAAWPTADRAAATRSPAGRAGPADAGVVWHPPPRPVHGAVAPGPVETVRARSGS
ncbi:hypothetical protein [Streptomyces sp. SGAir0957]